MLCLVAGLAGCTSVSAEEAVRGVVRALRDANIATELNARVLRIPFREGSFFARGDVLLEFDCAKQRAEARSTEAEAEAARIAHENAQELDRRRAIGRFDLQTAKANWDKARGAADALLARVRECTIVAPFAGRLVDVRIRDHEIATPGQPLFRLVGDGELEIDLIVPSPWLVWLREGAPLSARIDETGRTYAARVSRTAAAVDPVSQTIKITAAFAEPLSGAVLPGMSLDAIFERVGN
ncbi:efflux RND transporter periplasmic adaptor subunit [Methylobacterium iners]|uniref:efflux RND transporter periplasmic adaptor subunit n=1 Tax=Methylobacterium iners TaxID=418707 RepID=UPI003612196A